MSLDSIEDRQVVTLSVPRPLPGFKYRLEWGLIPQRDYEAGKFNSITPQENELFARCIRLLLQETTKRGVSHLLGELKTAIARAAEEIHELGTKMAGDDIELSFLVFDRDTMCLKIAGATFSEGDRRWEQTFPWGVGIAGQAYKRGAPLFSGGANRYYVRPPGHTRDHTVLHAIPIWYPRRSDLPLSGRRILGILSLGSYEPTSYLFHFSSSPAGENSKQIGTTKECQEGLLIAVNGLYTDWLVCYLRQIDRPKLSEAGEG